MLGNLIAYCLVALSLVYIVYYCFLVHFAIKEYDIIFAMYIKSKEKGIPFEFPDYKEISFDISLSTLLKARAFNKRMESVYKEINHL